MPSVSVCMICGNEAAVITRLLRSALPFMRELCLVRAIGDNQPDTTLEIAREFCEQHGVAFRSGEYVNKSPMPHIDDFGAARNQSFDLATSDWLIWLDCDDYLDEINALRIEEAAQTCTADAIYCMYRIEDRGGVISRERLIRRGKGRWVGTIHETCKVDGVILDCPQITVFHANPGAKTVTSAERNLRILEAGTADDARSLFYLHAELFRVGRHKEALIAAQRALEKLAPEQKEERYFVLINLAQLDPENEAGHLLHALQTQPHRREALADLCQMSLRLGNKSDAASYFRMMDALPEPNPLPWTHRGMWHAWARDLLRVRVLKAQGAHEIAEQDHVRYMRNPEYAQAVEEFP